MVGGWVASVGGAVVSVGGVVVGGSVAPVVGDVVEEVGAVVVEGSVESALSTSLAIIFGRLLNLEVASSSVEISSLVSLLYLFL